MNQPPQIKSYYDDTFRRSIHPLSGHATNARDQGDYARSLAREFTSAAFDNLDDFPYVYLTSGVTEAMDWVLPRHRVAMIGNDYRYAKFYERASRHDLLYQSYPYSADGGLHPITSEELPVFMDCAYLFATAMEWHNRQVPENVQYLAFSLSKSHNIADFRIGWLMTKQPLEPQHIVQYGYGYVPHRHARVLEHALSYPPNTLYQKYRALLSRLYADAGLRETFTNLFGIDAEGQRIPYYAVPAAGA